MNDIRQAGRLADLMEASSSARLLTAPLYVKGRICGFLDIRDKAGREPFVADDIVWVKEVLRRLAARVATLPEFAGEEADSGEVSPLQPSGSTLATLPEVASPILARPDGASPPFPGDSGGSSYLPSSTERVLKVVQDRLQGAREVRKTAPKLPPSPEIAQYRIVLEAMLQLPDVEMAAISRFSPSGVAVWYAAGRPVAPDVEQALDENIDKVFGRTGAKFSVSAVRTHQPLNVAAAERAPFGRSEIGAIQSSVLATGPEEVSVLSLLFLGGRDVDGRERLRSVHLLVKSAIAELRAAEGYREAFRGLVNRFLEPGLKHYGALKAHSYSVGRLARKFAGFLSLSGVETEQLTVAAILHDVAMRELNYEELSTKRNLDVADVKLIRQHPAVGALLVEEVAWPYPVGQLIRQHHERWDGAGYPDGLCGSSISFGARLIHLCEAFDAMTAQTSYRQVLVVPQALDVIVSKAGSQFDPELAPAFRKMVESLRT